ncbi:MAG: TRAP transporter small permease [Desulfuromonadales bacterium]|nr:TRAP transporter small permease [Desulfuromonadales bacterium]MBN2791354.1 TRAP transporter small permease [Desulfuromonadales bacterium]
MIGIFEKFSRRLGVATGAVVVCMMSIAMISLNVQVFTRYVMGQSASWSEELAMFLFSWSVLLVGSLGVREKFHVSLTFVLSFAPPMFRFLIEKFLHLITLVFGVFLATSGMSYVERTLGQVSAAVQYPVEWLHYSAPVSGVLICVHAFAHLLAKQSFENPEAEPSESSGSLI